MGPKKGGREMRFNVSRLLREPVGATRAYRVKDRQDATDEIPSGQIDGTVSFLRTTAGILVTTCLSVATTDRCSRCLEPLNVSYEVDFQEEFLPTVDVHTGARLPREDEDSFTIDEQQMLDLGEAVRQYGLTARSMHPLCREDCRGLCPECGGNLNLGPCSCPPGGVDSRWRALAELCNIAVGTTDKEGGN